MPFPCWRRKGKGLAVPAVANGRLASPLMRKRSQVLELGLLIAIQDGVIMISNLEKV